MASTTTEQARFNMVQQQIRPWNVFDQRVLNVLDELPRDTFVPEKYRGLAYADTEIPLGGGEQMMFPRMEARLLQALDIQPEDKILEIGTGSGYLTACLAKLGKSVISIDINSAMTDQARFQLEAQGIANVELRTDDGVMTTVEGGPFDVIAITGSLPRVPDGLKQQLEVGGQLFVVIGSGDAMEASLITRVNEQAWRTEGLFETEVLPLNTPLRSKKFTF